ncbi:hypothetical protein [Lacinutrix jangbogonensis]|uniref:hypothetical protein n=1 Tax=Lacinutrix jangbogonensis TaxID=1469557 RepID=UPI00053E7D1E|nr:hypothetical protein [Lacinutrix jangbogonensis]
MDENNITAKKNLVLSLKDDGTYRVVLLNYNLTQQDLESYRSNGLLDFDTKITIANVDENTFSINVYSKVIAPTSGAGPDCLSFIHGEGDLCTAGDSHSWQDITTGGESCNGVSLGIGPTQGPVIGISTDWDCIDLYMNTGTGNPGSNGPSGTTGETTTQTNNGGSDNDVDEFNAAIDLEELDDDDCFTSDDSFNATYSLNSPFKVDLSDVRKVCDSISTPENEKFMCIYKKLRASPKFKDLFIDTFGESERLNVRFELDATLADGIGGTTSSDPLNQSTIIDGVAYSNYLIKINKNHLNSSSTLARSTIEIARNMIHECLHAYLYVKKRNCNDGTTIDFLNNQLLGELINEYYDSFCSQFQEQHEFMFDYMIPTIAEILEDVKDDLIPLSNQNQVSDLDYNNDIYPNNPFTESHLFNWDEFYEYISISGLHNTTEFQQEIATDSIKNYLFYRYASPTTGTARQFSKDYCNE